RRLIGCSCVTGAVDLGRCRLGGRIGPVLGLADALGHFAGRLPGPLSPTARRAVFGRLDQADRCLTALGRVDGCHPRGCNLPIAGIAPFTVALTARLPLIGTAVVVSGLVLGLVLLCGLLFALLLPVRARLLLVFVALLVLALLNHLLLRFTEHPAVVLGVLKEALSGNTVARKLGITRQRLILFNDLLRGAAHFA